MEGVKNFSIFDDSQYLPLRRLAGEVPYSYDFLLAAVRSGRLKAFKSGDRWLTSYQWFNQYHQALRREIEQAAGEPGDGWSERLPNRQFSLKPAFGYSLAVILVMVLISAAILTRLSIILPVSDERVTLIWQDLVAWSLSRLN